MKKASSILKQLFSVITAVVKAKTIAVKNKTSTIKARFLPLGILRNKKLLMSVVNHKFHALMSRAKNTATIDHEKAIVPYNAAENGATQNVGQVKVEYFTVEDDDVYPDLRHTLFDLEDDDDDDELGDGTGSVIDLVKNSKEDGSEFCLEDEIDHVADVFIRRFHKQIKMQKLESFKRFQEMLERSV